VGSIVKGVAGGELLAHGIERLGEAAVQAFEAVPHLVESTIHLGAELLTTSLKTGISVEGLSKLRFVASQTGTDLGGLTSAIFRMEANLGSASDKVKTALKQMGLSLTDLKASKPDEAFITILDKMREMPGAAARAAAGVAIFGKGFREIAQLAQEDISGLIEEAQKLGIVMSTETAASAKAAEDAMKLLNFQLEASANRLGAALIPAVIGVSADLSEGFKAAIDAANEGLGKMGGSGGFLDNVVAAMGAGDVAIAAQTELYYQLRDGVISVVRYGLEPFVTALGFVMVELNASRVVWHDTLLLIEDLTLAFEYAGRAMAFFHGDIPAVRMWNTEIERTTNEIYRHIAAIQSAKQNEQDWGKWASDINKEIEIGLKAVSSGHVDVAAIIKRVADMSRQAAGQIGDAFEDVDKEATKAAKQLKTELESVSEGFIKIADGISKLQDAQDELQFKGEAADAAAQIASIADLMSDNTTRSEEFEASLSDILGLAGRIQQRFQEGTHGTFVGDLFGSVPGAIQAAIQGGGSKLQAAGSAIGSALFGKDSSITKSITGMFSADGFLGKTLGQAVPVIGSLIGPAIDGLMKLFGDHAGKDLKNMGHQLGVEFSSGLIDQIKADSKKYGGEVQGLLVNLDKVISEAGGVAAFGVDKAIGKLHDVYALIGQHQLTVSQGTKIIDANFAEVAAAGTDAYGRISTKLKEVIRLDDEFGTKSKAIASFLQTQGNNALSGFAAVADAATPFVTLKKNVQDAQAAVDQLVTDGKAGSADWKTANDALVKALADQAAGAKGAKDELGDLGIQAVASFSAAVQAGVPWSQALSQINPQLQNIKGGYEALGIPIEDVALKTLLVQSSMATAAPALMAGVAGLSQEFVALDNLSAVTPENFAAMERTGERMFTRLQTEAQKAGGDSKDALLPMQAFLHQAEDAAHKYGLALDEGTQALIDQSKQQGIWKEEGESANDIMIEGFSAIIQALGGELPAAWQKMADEAKRAAEKAAQASEQAARDAAAAAEQAARDAQAAMDGLTAPDLTINVGFNTSGWENSPDAGGQTAGASSRGSYVSPWGLSYFKQGGVAGMLAASLAALFVPRGTDRIPAMLSVGEGVVNVRGMGQLGVEGLRSLNRGESVAPLSRSGASDMQQVLNAVTAASNAPPSLVISPGAIQINNPVFAEDEHIEQKSNVMLEGIQRLYLRDFARLVKMVPR
jgi:hypothetical protein